MSKCFITGTSGHVGSILYDYLIDHFDVYEINSSKHVSNNGNNFTYETIYNDQNCLNNLGNSDFLIHVSSVIDFCDLSTEISYFNAYETHRLFAFFRKCGLKKIILISSAPIVGNNFNKMDENSLPNLKTVYHLSKYYQEKLIEILNFDFFYILRLSSPISHKINKNTIFKTFLDCAIKGDNIRIFGKGTRSQNYIDVRNLYSVIKKIHEDNPISGVYNICADHSLTNVQLAETIIKILSSSSTYSFYGEDLLDDQFSNFDNSKAKLNLNLTLNYNLQDTIVDYVKAKS
jgi:nucleoside-diphosphate-sugar epimerase